MHRPKTCNRKLAGRKARRGDGDDWLIFVELILDSAMFSTTQQELLLGIKTAAQSSRTLLLQEIYVPTRTMTCIDVVGIGSIK